jgi:hypothetical protein
MQNLSAGALAGLEASLSSLQLPALPPLPAALRHCMEALELGSVHK